MEISKKEMLMDRIEQLAELYQKLKGSIFLRLAQTRSYWHSLEIKNRIYIDDIELIEATTDMTFEDFVKKWQ